MTRANVILRSAAFALSPLVLGLSLTAPPRGNPKCDPDNGGLVLPEGFCATVVASGLGPVRQLAVAPNGDLYAALSGKFLDATGGVLAFRDRDGDGKPDERASFGPGGGNDVVVHDGYLYFAPNDRIVRYRLSGKLEPEGKEETVVTGLPDGGNHKAKSLAFGSGDSMFVVIGSATNSSGSGTEPDSGTPCPGLVPHVTNGLSVEASR